MPYNPLLADKIREALQSIPNVEEKEKMGGLSFMVNGKMCLRVDKDDLMLSCDPALTEDLLQREGARRYVMKGKTNMKGWLLIDQNGTSSKEDMDFWVSTALDWNQKVKKKK